MSKHAKTETSTVNELDPDLFYATIQGLDAILPEEARSGAVAARRSAFGPIQLVLLPGFESMLGDGTHVSALEGVMDDGYEVVTVPLKLVENRRGLKCPQYGVFWRNTLGDSPRWHENVVTLDPDSVPKASKGAEPRHPASWH